MGGFGIFTGPEMDSLLQSEPQMVAKNGWLTPLQSYHHYTSRHSLPHGLVFLFVEFVAKLDF